MTTGVISGVYRGYIARDNGKENGNYYSGLYWGYIGIMEKKMETAIVGYIGAILG